jgi:hypothetical protein
MNVSLVDCALRSTNGSPAARTAINRHAYIYHNIDILTRAVYHEICGFILTLPRLQNTVMNVLVKVKHSPDHGINTEHSFLTLVAKL